MVPRDNSAIVCPPNAIAVLKGLTSYRSLDFPAHLIGQIIDSRFVRAFVLKYRGHLYTNIKYLSSFDLGTELH